MPTPFTHLHYAERLLADRDLPGDIVAALHDSRPAYLLGATVADARIDAPDSRAATHFYTYTEPMNDHPWRLMLNAYPSLDTPGSAAHRAFVAGYVFHLAMDEIWTLRMLAPFFAFAAWGDSRQARFFVLHLLLIDMDMRDFDHLTPDAVAAYAAAQPGDWLPFMPRTTIEDWRALIHEQIRPGGASQTEHIFGERVGREAEDLHTLVSDADWMQANLWDHVPREAVADVEALMWEHARAALLAYWSRTEGAAR